MTLIDLIDAKIAECDKATPGPWSMETVPTSCGRCHKIGPFPERGRSPGWACVYEDHRGDWAGDTTLLMNAKFMASARTDLPAALRALSIAVKCIKGDIPPEEALATIEKEIKR